MERVVPVSATDLQFNPNDIYPTPLSLVAVEQLLQVYQQIVRERQGDDNAAAPHPSRSADGNSQLDCPPATVEAIDSAAKRVLSQEI